MSLPPLYPPILGETPLQIIALGTKDLTDISTAIATRIYNGEKIIYDAALLNATAKELMNGIQKGCGKDIVQVDWNSPDQRTLDSLTQNTYQFAAAKNYQQLRDMTTAIRDGNKIRTFEEYSRQVEPIIAKYNRDWLRSEYNQAIAASQSAARWNEFKTHDEMPYLQYAAIMDANTRSDHAALHGIIKHIDDPFWNQYMPPNGWGCRCEVVQLPGSLYKETPDSKIFPPSVPKMFKRNFGKEGIAFPEDHAFYKQMPQEVWQELQQPIRKGVNKYYNDVVNKQAKKLNIQGSFKNLVSGKIHISNRDIKNVANHLPGIMKLLAIKISQKVDKWELLEQGVKKNHESNKTKFFSHFNYYSIKVNKIEYHITCGVKDGEEKLYAIRTKK